MKLFIVPEILPYGHNMITVVHPIAVERRFVPVTESEDTERCGRLRVLLLHGAQRLSGVSETKTQGKEAEHATD